MNKTVMKAAMLTACLVLSSGMFLFSQQGSKGKSAVKKEVKQVKSESTDVEEHKVVRQAKDHDIEEAERNKTFVMPEHKVKKGAKSRDTSGKATYSDEIHRKTVRLEESATQGDQKVKDARTKIEEARVKLEADKKAGKLTEAAYNDQKEKITSAEAAVKELELHVRKGRELEMPAGGPVK